MPPQPARIPVAPVRRPSRREFLRHTLSAPLLLAASAAMGQRHPPPGAEELTHYQLGPQIWFRWNNAPLTCYRAQPQQKYPYFFPLSGPVSGLSLTSETAEPWPHHRSLFFACDRVNGGNYWQEGLERGQIVSRGPRITQSTKLSAVLEDACDWAVPGQPAQMTDLRRFTLTVRDPRLWMIDAEITWQAVVDVTIQKTNHALYSLRSATDLAPWGGGTLTSSEGVTGEAATFGKPARWCAFHGRRGPAGSGPVEGIALFEHPSNPWAPCPWFTRDYGMISPMPFNWLKEPWKLGAGESVRVRYRTVCFAGSPDEAGLEALYRDWAGA